MTIAKFIECEVAESMCPAFSESQSKWHQLSECKGFEGQFGGWDVGNSNAIIICLWQSHDDIANFMQIAHDEIAKKSNQSTTYNKCNVQHFELESTSNIPSVGVFGAKILQITHCQSVTDEARFIRDQQLVWNRAKSNQDDMLGGCLWRNCLYEHNFMALTYWASISSHDSYCNSVLPQLRQEVRPTRYMKKLSGAVVKIERAWDVIPYKL